MNNTNETINKNKDSSDTFICKNNEGSTISSKPINISHAQGIYLWDLDGKRYCDMFSQTWSMPLGHNIPTVNSAVRKQLSKITHLRTAYNTTDKIKLTNKIIELAPKGFSKVHFVLHGSLAVEGAMKLAINNYSNRDKILYLEGGFHGRSFATMGISWKHESKFKNYFNHGIEVKKKLEDISEKMKSEKPAAIIIELIQGNSGCNILDKEFVKGIRELCDKENVVMIIDEIQTGFGCMGTNFLCEKYDITPDILVFGKAIGGGFPLAGTIYKEKFFLKSGDHSFTFAQNPISLTAGLSYLEELQKSLKNVEILEILIKEFFDKIEKKYSFLEKSRVLGTKGAIDVLDNFGNSDSKTTDIIVSKLLDERIIISNSKYLGMGNTLMIQPPLITTKKQLKYIFQVFEKVLNTIYLNKKTGEQN